jgi:hypothetical protein
VCRTFSPADVEDGGQEKRRSRGGLEAVTVTTGEALPDEAIVRGDGLVVGRGRAAAAAEEDGLERVVLEGHVPDRRGFCAPRQSGESFSGSS